MMSVVLVNALRGFTLGLLLVAGAAWSRPSRAFTPFVPQPLPQRATGDFDGDGRPDVAHIQGDEGPGAISILLSGSAATIHLDANVGAVIDEDIDHDGDLDLVASTASGDVLIWLNDSHGRFTQQERSRTRDFTGEPMVVNGDANEPAALLLPAPLLLPPAHVEAAVVATQIRPPTAPLAFDLNFLLRQTLRAPPTVSA